MKQVAGRLRLDLAQYRELAAFAQFGSDLDKATQARLARGERIVEILKQDQYEPMPVEEQVVVIYTAVNGYLDDIEVSQVRRFEEQFLNFLRNSKPEILKEIREKKELSDELVDRLNKAIEEFKKTFAS
ncbi:ATP synthase F0F1 subunit alpha [Calderihabitans maritimus]|uniref:ATP synthase F0F1 subunit alpha n=1 Tax=Calderihabitans maritimus TaxID=1246530 RepID=A0A1Z5HWV1_9FIRM|nr:ATP synthase F0F1 subunit alpha [Calderihabitans maritimus]